MVLAGDKRSSQPAFPRPGRRKILRLLLACLIGPHWHRTSTGQFLPGHTGDPAAAQVCLSECAPGCRSKAARSKIAHVRGRHGMIRARARSFVAPTAPPAVPDVSLETEPGTPATPQADAEDDLQHPDLPGVMQDRRDQRPSSVAVHENGYGDIVIRQGRDDGAGSMTRAGARMRDAERVA